MKKPINKKVVKNRKPTNKKVAAKETSVLIPWRYNLILGFIVLALVTLVARTAYIQIIEPDQLIQQADMRSVRVKSIPTARGIISDRNGEPLAVSVPVQAVWADPATIIKENGLDELDRWYALANVLGLDQKGLVRKLQNNKKKRFIYLQRQVSPAMSKYVRELKLPGIGLKDESRRFYPSGEVSAHVIGVTGIDGHGLEGLESSFDNWLTGEAGKRTIRKDRYGRVVENISLKTQEPGKPLQLTIDQRLQAISYRAIKQAVADFRATSGTAVLIDVKSGDILAMVNAPSYNPNNRAQLQSFRMRNRAITDSIEPGSTMKPFVMLAALDKGVVDDDTIIDTGNGIMRVGGSRVRDSALAGKADLTTILKKSSNVGIATIALRMDVKDVLGMYSGVGFGNVSGIQLTGEVTGIFPDRRRWSPFEEATLAFGYGISVTPLQLAHAYATLGNFGVNMPLHLLKGSESGRSFRAADADASRKVINMLEQVTHKGGTATSARVAGFRVGAKTGTSRKAKAGGYSDQYVALTAGIAPISNPRLALVVVVNEPQGDQFYGGSVAGPVFSEIMKGALQILNITPDATPESEKGE
ncbi:penicillin-binding transpeptidase domain-containing protein [Vibrio casei]|uniref:penicillin-binding transpeptidase domain-containing protein n=1 Tax=Vibrio casei TaxID=673372 RepID=UPI00097E8C98|nr:penicillin-binding transpeptidase domain-containing protein [Vibrio casei]SJN36417.1 Cell division protein FtsI [Peptidoglycan synthetase] [Vibrio casei]